MVGVLEGNQVIAELAMEQWAGSRSIRYRVWVEDANLGTRNLVAVGYFGNYDPQWEVGQNVTIAMARAVNEIWFYVDGYGTVVKYCPLDAMDFIESYCQIFVWTDSNPYYDSNITANVNNVNVAYCSEGS